MNEVDKSIQNLTNSGLEQVSFAKGQTIYQFNENPKFAYFVYTGKVNIVSKTGYNLGTVNEGELFGEQVVSSTKNTQYLLKQQLNVGC